MADFKLVAPCLLGVEGIAADELRRMGAKDVAAQNGRVVFSGDEAIIARSNLTLRTAERVLILLSEFKAFTFEALFEHVKQIPFERFIGKLDAFPVTGYSISSKLHSVPDCQSIIKKAVVERLKSKYNIHWFEETGTLYQIRFSIMKDHVSVMIDTSGEGLHKRGYRPQGLVAPIKETLAAAIVNLARVRDRAQLYDPFCGSGTILIEGALSALNIAPGIRRNFASERFEFIPQQVFKDERTRALDLVIRSAEFKGVGSDIDQKAIELSQLNAKRAGVDSKLTFKTADIQDFKTDTERAVVITNPPYGERLLNKGQAEELYKTMGKVFQNEKGKSYHIICPDEDFETLFGRPADKRRKLYNGMIKCHVYMYFK